MTTGFLTMPVISMEILCLAFEILRFNQEFTQFRIELLGSRFIGIGKDIWVLLIIVSAFLMKVAVGHKCGGNGAEVVDGTTTHSTEYTSLLMMNMLEIPTLFGYKIG